MLAASSSFCLSAFLFNASTFIKDNYKNSRLIKIIDILGRESKEIKKQLLSYIYDDGTVEKRIITTN